MLFELEVNVYRNNNIQEDWVYFKCEWNETGELRTKIKSGFNQGHLQKIWQVSSYHDGDGKIGKVAIYVFLKDDIVFWPLFLDVFLESWILFVRNGMHQFPIKN